MVCASFLRVPWDGNADELHEIAVMEVSRRLSWSCPHSVLLLALAVEWQASPTRLSEAVVSVFLLRFAIALYVVLLGWPFSLRLRGARFFPPLQLCRNLAPTKVGSVSQVLANGLRLDAQNA